MKLGRTSQIISVSDYRPLNISLSNLVCKKGDLTNIPFADNSIQSLSSMHVVEHIGLTRYGDQFDPQGDLIAMRELQRVLAPKGILYFVVPMGHTARIEYNGHRIYTYQSIIGAFSSLKLNGFVFIDDVGIFHENATETITMNSKYGCGCFEFGKNGTNQHYS